MNSNNPLVSIVMATYNEPPTQIEKAIASILNQSYRNLELLIYDDSTNPETISVIDSFCNDERVKIHRFSVRLGFVPSLNKGLEEAKGEYIARMDGDDIALPERIEKEVSVLEACLDVAVIGGAVNIIDANDKITSKRVYPLGGLRLRLYSCIRSPLAHPTVMMRRLIIDAGYKYDTKLQKSEDLDLWLRLLNSGYKIINLPYCVLSYRVADNFNTKRNSKEQWKYTAYVRRKNFSFRYFFFSVLSVVAGTILSILPKRIIDRAYNKENQVR